MKTKTHAKNEMKLVIPSHSANESFARSTVAAFIAQLDPTIDEMTDIKTAVSEAVTNCIVHAYKDTIGNIWIEARIYDDGRLCVTVRGKGCGIPGSGVVVRREGNEIWARVIPGSTMLIVR